MGFPVDTNAVKLRVMDTFSANSDHDCPQCKAAPGEAHRDWDGIARCFESGEQLIACSQGHPGECSPSVWDGEYPGVKQCRALDLYVVDPEFGRSEDLNYFAGIPKQWNRESQSWDLLVKLPLRRRARG